MVSTTSHHIGPIRIVQPIGVLVVIGAYVQRFLPLMNDFFN